MKTTSDNHPPFRRPIFLLFRSRPAQASALRSEASRALRSRAKKSEFASPPSRKKGLPASQKSPTNAPSARPAEF